MKNAHEMEDDALAAWVRKRSLSSLSSLLPPPPPPRSPVPPALIDSLLPAEIISHLLEIASCSEQEEDGTLFKRYKMLRRASLVNQRWSHLARESLWSNISLSTYWGGRALLNSPAFGRYQTLSLELVGHQGVTITSAQKIICSIPGLRHLKLIAIRGIKLDWLCSPNLSGLTSLSLEDSPFLQPLPSSLKPPFYLTRLNIESDGSSPLPFTTFSSPHLHHLRFRSITRSQHSSLLSFLKKVGHQLRTIDCGSHLSGVFVEAFECFEKVEKLSVGCSRDDLVRIGEGLSGRGKLKEFELLNYWENEGEGGFVQVLEKVLGMESFKGVKQVMLPLLGRESEDGKRVEEVLRGRGIEVLFRKEY